MNKGLYGIPGKVPDLTIGDGKIDNPQEVYDFLKDMPEYSKLVQVLSLLATKESLDEVVEELADKSAHDEARNLAAIMSLATDPNAGVTISTTNPEWKLVYTDAEEGS